MNRYSVRISLEVEVEAFDTNDALDAVKDVFGPGENCGLQVNDYELLDYDELT